MSGQMSLGIDTTGQEEMRKAREWREANPGGYAAIVAWAHEDAERVGRCAMQRYFEALRDPASARLFVHRSDAVYFLNHNLRSALTRLVMAEHPELPFHPRKSRCDRHCLTNETPKVQPW